MARALGVDVIKVQRRAGHDSISTTMGYVKAAEDISGAVGTPFPELPPSLLGPMNGPAVSRDGRIPDAGRFRRRDSNPDKRIQNPLSCH